MNLFISFFFFYFIFVQNVVECCLGNDVQILMVQKLILEDFIDFSDQQSFFFSSFNFLLTFKVFVFVQFSHLCQILHDFDEPLLAFGFLQIFLMKRIFVYSLNYLLEVFFNLICSHSLLEKTDFSPVFLVSQPKDTKIFYTNW